MKLYELGFTLVLRGWREMPLVEEFLLCSSGQLCFSLKGLTLLAVEHCVTAGMGHGAGSVPSFLSLGGLSAFAYILNGHGVKKSFFISLSQCIERSDGEANISSRSTAEVALQPRSARGTCPAFQGRSQQYLLLNFLHKEFPDSWSKRCLRKDLSS